MTLFVANAPLLIAIDAIADEVDAGAGAGLLKIYAGAVPTDADTALGAQTLLATLTMSDPAFGASTDQTPGGRAAASAITSDTSADATATATFFRLQDSNSVTKFQGAVATSGAELNLNTVAIVSGATVAVTSLNLDHPES